MGGVSMIDHRCRDIKTLDPDMTTSLQQLPSQNSGAASVSGRSFKVLTTNDGVTDRTARPELAGVGRDNVVTDIPDQLNFDAGYGDSTPQNFSIRDYVCTVRSNDIRKSWPFSQKYLKICLENGRKPLLPPFETPHSVRDLIQEEVELEAMVRGNDTERNNVSSEDTSDYLSEEKVEDPKHSENGFAVQGEVTERKQTSYTSHDRKLGEKLMQHVPVSLAGQTGDIASRKDVGITGNGNGCIVAENKPEEVGEFTQMTGELEEENGGPRNSRSIMGAGEGTDWELKDSFKNEHKENDSGADTEQFSESPDGHHEVTQGNSEPLYKPRYKRTESPDILSDVKCGFKTCKKQATKMLTAETKSHEEVNRCQKEVKRQEQTIEQSKSEDFANSGSIPDAMILKVCPVCKIFSSTSNTALNAHIDHCLAVEPNAEKTVTKITKHKIKARKKRSMADICAVAPTRTLEDLEHSTAEQLALDANPLHLDDFKWRDSKVRRQPRTPLSRGAKKLMDYVDPKGKKSWNPSNLNMQSRPNLGVERQQNEHLVSEERDDESQIMKKNKRSALSTYTEAGQSLDSSSFNNFEDKVALSSPVKHTSHESLLQGKSQDGSQETVMKEKLPRSTSAWACFNKQGSSRTKKFKHKRVSLKLAGAEQLYCNQDDSRPMDVLELKTKNHLEFSTLSEGTITESKELPGRSMSPRTDKQHDPPMSMSRKRSSTKRTVKVLGNNFSPSAEAEEFLISKRMKNLSSLNFLHKTIKTASRGQSSICETKSPTSGKGQGEEEVSFWYCDSNEEKRQSLPGSDENSGNDVMNPRKSESVAVSRTVESEKGLSLHGTQSSVPCQLGRVRSKDRFLEDKHLVNVSTSKRPNPFQLAAGSPSKKSPQFRNQAVRNCISEYPNGDQKRARHFKCNIGSQKMKKVAHIVHDLNTKDATKIDAGKIACNPESNSKSPEFIYDAGSTSNRAYSVKLRDCISPKEQLIRVTETSGMDGQARSCPTLHSVTMPATEFSTKHLERSTSVKINHAELAGETQAQLDSTVSTICEVSQKSCAGAVGIDESPQHCTVSNVTTQLMGDSLGSLEVLKNKPSCQQDDLLQGLSNQVTARLSLHQGEQSTEFYGAFQKQSTSGSSRELVDTYSDDTLGKKVGSQKLSETQFTSVTDAVKETLLSVSWQKQTLRHKSPIQNDILCPDSMNAATATLNPSNRKPRSDSIDLITTATASISGVSTKSLYNQSTAHQLTSQWEPSISHGTIVLNSDSIGVAPVSNDTNFANKLPVSSELMTESTGISRLGLRNLNERTYAISQKFGSLAASALGHSIHPSSSTTSIGLPLTSQGGLLQERAMQLQDSQLVGNRECSFGTNMMLTSATVPRVVSASHLAVDSGETHMTGEILHGSVLNLSPPNPQSIPVWQSSNNISAWLLEKQNGLKQTSSNLSFGVMDGMNGSCVGNHAEGSSPQIFNVPSCRSTLASCKSEVHSGSKWHQAISGNQFSGSSSVSTSGLITMPDPSDFPQRFPAVGNAGCSSEPSVVHIFGNPILRLMGKNVMVSSKDGMQSKQMERGVSNSSEGHPNVNYLSTVEFTSEAKSRQERRGHFLPELERSFTFDQNILQPFEGECRRDSGSFWHGNDYRQQQTAVAQNLSDVSARNLAGSASQSLAGTSLTNTGEHPRSTTKKPLSYVSPGLMDNGLFNGPGGIFHQAKWQSPSTALPQSDPEVIIIDDILGTEARSNAASFAPTFLQGEAYQLQEGLSMSSHLKLNSRFRSENKFSVSSSTASHFSSDKALTVACGSNLLSVKDIPAELRKLGINSHAN
eukprot:Gb_21512 [translate_table: standard]